MTKQLRTAIVAILIMSAFSLHAQTDTTTPRATTKKAKTVKPAPETKEQRAIREMQAQMAAQQAQIDALNHQLADKNAALADTQSTAAAAQSQAAAATAAAQSATTAAQSAAAAAQTQADSVTTLKSTVTDLQTSNAGLATTISATKQEISDKIDSPAAIHYKGITITPVAYFAFEGVWRQHSVNSDINTPFNSIPFPSANEGHVSELNFSGRQSRLGGLFEGNAGSYKLSGYAEMDFLGTGTSSNNNQSNSYVLRQRQIWGKAETHGGFAVTGGQMWSLVTENRKSTDTRTEIQPQTIDPQYLAGYTWTRQPGIRIQQRFGDVKTGALTLALSAEQAQITSFTANGTVPTQYFFGGLGQNGGLYNAAASTASATTTCTSATPPVCTTTVTTGNITSYANNVAPDVIVKGAYDNSIFHLEIGGIARFLRDEYFPVTTTGTGGTPTYTYATTGPLLSHTSDAGGVFGAARVYVGKIAEVAVQAMAGQGVGRYGSSQLADATLRPDETLEPIRNYHGLFSLETHPTPKLDIYFYYGGEYAQRTVYTTAAGNLIGYGPRNLSDAGCYNLPSSVSTTIGTGVGGTLGATTCGSPTRYIQEAMGGLTYRVASSPKYGRLQYQMTYSYLQRNLWSGVGSATTPSGPRATDPMIHVSMRYYIP
jgi:hypothetical protein